MICPCGEYEFIDSTAQTLADAMTCKYHFQVTQIHISLYTFFLLLLSPIALYADHREHGNRIIHEKLTGTRVFRGMRLDPREQE